MMDENIDWSLIYSGGVPTGAGSVTTAEKPSALDNFFGGFVNMFSNVVGSSSSTAPSPAGAPSPKAYPEWLIPVAIGGSILVAILVLTGKSKPRYRHGVRIPRRTTDDEDDSIL